MLDGVPFRSAARVVGDGNGKGKRVGQLGLQFGLPGVAATAVAAAAVGQDEKLA